MSPEKTSHIPQQRSAGQPSATATVPENRPARLLTEIFSPGILVAALLIAVAWHSAASVRQAVTMGLIAVVSASLLPMYYILRGVRRRTAPRRS